MKTNIKKYKDNKRKRILDAAVELYFTSIKNEPSVTEITKKANVAKGTFYLYFKNKEDLEEQLVIMLTNKLIMDSVVKIETLNDIASIDRIVAFIDIIIDYFKDKKILLSFIEKKLSWGLYREIQSENESYKEAREGINKLCSHFINEFENTTFSKEELFLVLSIIIEMVNGVVYNSILNEEPGNIDEIRPVLIKCIRGILNQ